MAASLALLFSVLSLSFSAYAFYINLSSLRRAQQKLMVAQFDANLLEAKLTSHRAAVADHFKRISQEKHTL